ncbi:hypothetical protein HDV63DRAFT_375222 [Trichoderma sp. SZMC 28014]
MTLARIPSVHAVLGISLTFVLATFFLSPSYMYLMESRGNSPSPIAGLRVAIEQTSSSPLTITSTVFNNNEHTVTFLVYNSPLDTAAPSIGLLTITPDGASKPLDLPKLQIQRQWPPSSESLIQLEPGASQTAEILLKEFIVSKVAGKASVMLKGRWEMVWNKQKDDFTAEMLEQAASRARRV